MPFVLSGSIYGIAIRPTMMSVGRTTPAIQGSKYTRNSCKPVKYQGALEGLGVTVGLAISSRGAFCSKDQSEIKIMQPKAAMYSRTIRCGQVSTLSCGNSCGVIGGPEKFSLRTRQKCS